MLLVGGIWLLCSIAALLALIPLCRMAGRADETDARALREATDVHLALHAGTFTDAAEPPFVTDVAQAPRTAPAAPRSAPVTPPPA